MNKRAGMLDWFYIIILMFLIGLVSLVSYKILKVTDDSEVFADTATAQSNLDKAKSTLLNMDNLMLFIIVGLSLFVIIGAAIVYHHPAFFIVGIVLLFIAIMFAAITSNTFWTFTNSGKMSDIAALYPKMTFLMNKLPLYIAFMGIAVAIVMYVAYTKD